MAAGNGLTGSAPFVLTLELDGDTFRRLDDLRRRYYAPERNMVPAHLTLFHQLPGDRGREIKALLRQASTGRKPIEIDGSEAKATERGVAVFLRSPQLSALRDTLAAEWWPWLTDQDRSGFRPHVTIQSNVSATEARSTLRAIGALRLPGMRGVGLHLWRYLGGPWEPVQLFRFS